MNLNIFKGLSIQKSFYTVILIFIAFIAISSIQQYFSLNYKNIEVAIAEQNRTLCQQIGLYAEIYARTADDEVLRKCQDAIDKHNDNLKTLEYGGETAFLGKVSAAPKSVKPTLESTKELWIEYKKHVEIILSEPLYIDETSVNLNISPEILKEDSLVLTSTTKAFNPVTDNSRKFVENNADRMLKKNNELVYAYLKISDNVSSNIVSNIVVSLIFFSILGLAIFYLSNKYLFKPLNDVSATSQLMAYGDYSKEIDYDAKNEVGELAKAVNLLQKKLKNISKFIKQISANDLEMDIASWKNEEGYAHDTIVDDLYKTQIHLKKLDTESREKQWVNEGLNKFNNILRDHADDQQNMLKVITSELAHYVHAVHAAIFTISQESGQEKMKMRSSYAFEMDYETEDVSYLKGQSLIGQTWEEGQITYLTEVPDSYTKIRSGLGDAAPTAILIIPIMIREHVIGIIELSSFQHFESYEIQFLKELGSYLAASLTIVQNNEKTQRMFMEAQEATEELRSQEEEMRQNMEELQATQEQLMREKQSTEVDKDRYILLMDLFPQSCILINTHGNIVKVSDQFTSQFGWNDYDLKDKNITEITKMSKVESLKSLKGLPVQHKSGEINKHSFKLKESNQTYLILIDA